MMLWALPTTTPTPQAAEVIEQATKVIDTWNQLGPIMGLLFVVSLALIVITLILYASRNSNTAAINILANVSASKDRDISELKAQREQDRKAHIESLTAISAQATRSNDLWDAMQKQGENRIKQQSEIVSTQGRIAASFDKLLSEGSVPLQKVASDVAQLMLIANSIDSKTNGIDRAIEAINQIKSDIVGRLDDMTKELSKRQTKPIPLVPPMGENTEGG